MQLVAEKSEDSSYLVGVSMKIKPEIRDIVQKLDVSQPVSFDSVLTNIDNDIYFLTDSSGKKIVLREAKRIHSKDPDFEVRLISSFIDNNVCTPRLIKWKNDVSYYTNAGGWQIFAFEFIAGKQIDTKDIIAKPEMAFAGGQILGTLHKVALQEKISIGVNTKRNAFSELDLLFSRDTSKIKQIEGFDQFIEVLHTYEKEAMQYMNEHPDECGAIHNDYGPQNIIFTESGTYVIDLDWACEGPLKKDVGQGIALWSLENNGLDANNEIIYQFITGYNTTAPISIPEELDEEISFWIRYSCLSDACTFFHSFLDGRYTDINLTKVNQCHGYKRFEYFLNL